MATTPGPTTDPSGIGGGALEHAWNMLQAAREWARCCEGAISGPSEAAWGRAHASRAHAEVASGQICEDRPADAWLRWQPPYGWLSSEQAPASVRPLLDLYLPICNASAHAPVTVGHLGQSLDGYIATGAGDSYYVTGPENVQHLHRMRALCDAVLVGAVTVATDDPQLTVRHVRGENPVRVVLDPRLRLSDKQRVFCDGLAPTLVVCDETYAARTHGRLGMAEVVPVPAIAGRLDLAALLRCLHERGMYSALVEGGGRTVSGFLDAGLLDRLHIAIAPLVTGSGRRGLELPPRRQIAECLRPAHRVFRMGADVLFDCDLRSAVEATPHDHGDLAGLARVL